MGPTSPVRPARRCRECRLPNWRGSSNGEIPPTRRAWSPIFSTGYASRRLRGGERRNRAGGRRSERRSTRRTTMKTVLAASTLLLFSAPLLAQDDWLKQAASKKVATFDGSNADAPQDVKKDRRGKVVLRRLKPSCKSDWNTDPTALPYFFYQLRE